MKIFTAIAFLFLVTFSYAQKFTVTPEGLRNFEDNEKEYVVIQIEGMTAKELYDNSIKHINKNPDEVLKETIEAEYLSYDTYKYSLLFIKNGGIKQFFSAKYTTELNFKDGKIKYEIIELEMHHIDNNMSLYFTGEGSNWMIYNKNGVLKRSNAKTDIENYFNAEIKVLKEYLEGKSDQDNW